MSPSGVVLARSPGVGSIDITRPLAEICRSAAHAPWIWLHLAQAHEQTRSWLRDRDAVPDDIAEAMLSDVTRPVCEVREDGILFIGRGVNLDPASTPEDMVSLRCWVTPKRITTVVVRRLRSAEDTAAHFDQRGIGDTGEVLAHLIRGMAARMTPVVQELFERLDDAHTRIIDEQRTATTGELASLRLRGITLARYLAPLRDAVGKLIDEAPEWFDTTDNSILAATFQTLTRLVEDLHAMEAKATVARDELISQHDEKLGRRVYALTIIAALFLPLGFLTGLLGVNVAGIPGTDSPAAFWFVCGGLVVIIALQLVILRLLRWL